MVEEMKYPDSSKPVLAHVKNVIDLGTFTWYEVVYYDNGWCSYDESTTFDDGEVVLKWAYISDEWFGEIGT